ncbi:metal-dependent hydrolase [Haloarchaeobius baliensis]|uniref:metal-dependent hydrolase n=1 Tax=Haloarchaeobius baliensis TaxID=1670458 RepID=UPI003F88282E
MWPWGHLAFGYLCYSVLARLRRGRAPAALPVVVLALATQLPDLVDKPLAWSFEVFTTGYGVAHSLFLAVPLVLVAGLVAAAVDHDELGWAFGVGYLSHLLGDVLFGLAFGVEDPFGRVVWPLSDPSGYSRDYGFVERVAYYLEAFLVQLADGDLGVYVPLYLVLFTVVFGLWIADGVPPLGALYERLVTSEEN